MPLISQMKNSQFLSKADVDPPKLVTIDGCDQQNVAMKNDPEELKWVLHFVELEKPMVLNSTNAMLIAAALGSENTDEWIGKKIVLFNDPSIQFQGKMIGGIRCRAPRVKAAPAPAAAPLSPAPAAVRPAPAPAPAPAPRAELTPATEAEGDDDVPF